jgi:hypothetical protein
LKDLSALVLASRLASNPANLLASAFQAPHAIRPAEMLQELKAGFLSPERFGYIYQIHVILRLIGKS